MPQAKDRRRYLLWRTLGTALEQLPVPVAVAIAQNAGGVLARRDSATKRAVRENLRAVVEHGTSEAIDDRVLERMTRRAFSSYARYWAEGATLPAQSPGVIDAGIDLVEGRQLLTESMALGRGVIIALPHVGSWEWGGAMLARMGFPMTAVAEQLDPPELFDWFVEKRHAIGLEIEPLDRNAGKVMLSTLGDGRLVGLLCDRDLTGDGIAVEMFGRSIKVPAGPATLALRTGATLLAGVVFSGPGGQHCAHIVGPIDTTRQGRLRSDVQRVAQLLATRVESLIAERPEQWHVFGDAFNGEAPAQIAG